MKLEDYCAQMIRLTEGESFLSVGDEELGCVNSIV
jgi:hypothetical protein